MSDKNGKVPPQDITAEKSLLGAIMLAEDVISEVMTIAVRSNTGTNTATMK